MSLKGTGKGSGSVQQNQSFVMLKKLIKVERKTTKLLRNAQHQDCIKSTTVTTLTGLYFTVPLHFQYQNKQGAFLHGKFLTKLALVSCDLLFIIVLIIGRN